MSHIVRLAVLTMLVFAAMSVYLAIPSEGDYWESAPAREIVEETTKPLMHIFIGKREASRTPGAIAGEAQLPSEVKPEQPLVLDNPWATRHEAPETGATREAADEGPVVAAVNEPENVPPGGEQAVPTQKTYTVRKGDTIVKIAARILGSGKYADAILKVNPGLKPHLLMPGQEIAVPDLALDEPDLPVKVVEEKKSPARADEETKPAAKTDEETKPAPPVEAARPKFKWVTIAKGDTLYGIARQHCNDVRKVSAIVTLNRSVLRRGDREKLPVGQKIKVPVE